MKKVSTSAVLIFVTGLLYIFLFFLILPPSVLAEQNGKRPLTHEDYDAWKSIASSAISADGQWILYLEVPQDGDGELVVKNIKSAKTFRHAIGYTGEGTDSERAARPQFSYDSNHVKRVNHMAKNISVIYQLNWYLKQFSKGISWYYDQMKKVACACEIPM